MILWMLIKLLHLWNGLILKKTFWLLPSSPERWLCVEHNQIKLFRHFLLDAFFSLLLCLTFSVQFHFGFFSMHFATDNVQSEDLLLSVEACRNCIDIVGTLCIHFKQKFNWLKFFLFITFYRYLTWISYRENVFFSAMCTLIKIMNMKWCEVSFLSLFRLTKMLLANGEWFFFVCSSEAPPLEWAYTINVDVHDTCCHQSASETYQKWLTNMATESKFASSKSQRYHNFGGDVQMQWLWNGLSFILIYMIRSFRKAVALQTNHHQHSHHRHHDITAKIVKFSASLHFAYHFQLFLYPICTDLKAQL